MNITQEKNILSYKTSTDGLVIIRGTLRAHIPTLINKRGAAGTLSEMLLEGTTKYTKNDFFTKLALLGSEIDINASWMGISFNIESLPENLNKTLSLFIETLEQPSLPKEAFTRRKKQTLEAIRNSAHDTGIQARTLLMRELYDVKHPLYAHTTKEAQKNIKKITLKDIKNLHKKILTSAELFLTITGNIQDDTHLVLKKKFSKLLTNPAQAIPIAHPKKEQIKNTLTKHVPDKTSVHVYFGHTIPLTQEGDDFYPLLVGINILGKGGFSARLMRIVREEMGLTYSVGASISSEFDTYGNMFLIGAQFETKNTKKGIAAITKVLKDLIKSGATQDELEVIQESMLGNIHSYNASSTSLCSTLHTDLIKNRPSDFLKEYARKIEYVTLDEVNNALQKYIHPDILTITASGNIDKNLKEKS